MYKKITLFAILALAMGAAMAQSFSLRVGGAFPMGKFGDAKADYQNNNLSWGLMETSSRGGAGIGFMAGLQVKFDIKSVNGLGIIASVDGIFNALNSDINEYISDMVDDGEDSYDEYTVTSPKYINLPIMAGLSYTYPLKDGLALYGEAALGLNIRKITNYSVYEASGKNDRKSTLTYDAATTFAFRLGAGVVFNGKYTLGVDYYALGEAKATGTWSYEENGKELKSTDTFKGGKINPSLLTVRFGINF